MACTEAETRQNKIDRQLAQAGWSEGHGNLGKEFYLPRSSQVSESGPSYQVGDQYADYVLLGRDRKPIAVIEAKRSSRDPLVGERQASDYADLIQQRFAIEPFIFLANGEQIWFLDRGRFPVRQISGFFTRDDLERLRFQREYGVNPSPLAVQMTIIDRPYQIQAVKSITEGIEARHRKFLTVMATGTGKTRTAIALVDVLIRARWAQRVLFLADRRELVRQALGAFKQYLPHQSRDRVETGRVDHAARIHVATYPSMMQVHRQLSPGYYDLIITSGLPFDRWYRERLQELHGINLAGYEQFVKPAPPPQDQELFFEWTLASGLDG